MQARINGELNKWNTPFIIQRADPFVTRINGKYYFTASVPAYDKIILRCSDTLNGLKDAGERVIWEKHVSGPMSEHIWAPELHYINGCYYIYFAAGKAEDIWEIRPYVLCCKGDPMKDEFEELGMMQPADEDEFSFKAFSLDATTFEVKGERYFVWAEKTGVGKMVSNLYIAKMDTPNKLKTVQVLLTKPDYDWERVGFWVNEGPAVLIKDDKIYLTFSASATGACYCMGLLSADINDDLLDPHIWRKERYPVLKTDYDRGIYGPGHNSFVKDENGDDICIFHARTYEEIKGDPLRDPNRHAMLMRVEWTDRGPVFDYDNIIMQI